MKRMVIKSFLLLMFSFLSIQEVEGQTEMKRNEVLNVLLENQKVALTKGVIIEFPAGQVAPYHQHPCMVFGYIISGKCLLQLEGGETKILKAGDVFYEPANTPIRHFDNYSETEPLKFIAFYLLEDDQELIQLLPQKG